MRLIFVQPAVGHRRDGGYPRGWLMEPLSLATLAGLCPSDVEKCFFDDRLEDIDFDMPADAVLLPVETYTARRGYEIASAFRERGVPVIAGGFHATLMPDEVGRYAEAVVVGEAEGVFDELLDDLRHRTLRPRYAGIASTGDLPAVLADRSLYRGRRYLSVRLLEAARGCGNVCDFCAIHAFYGKRRRRRPLETVLSELRSLPPRALKFFVDDNFTADPAATKELLRAMIPLRCRWVTQMSIHAAHDEELLDLLHRAGCVGVLVGFESLEVETLRRMGKTFNSMRGGYEVALDNLRRHRIAVYATFVFGYDSDKPQVFEEVFDFAMRQEFYVAAFNHLIPFPGTPLHARLEQEGRLFSPAWWLDPAYRFGMVPFAPLNMSAHELTEKCQDLRRRFYSLRRILARCNRWNCGGGYLGRNFLPVNLLQRFEVGRRTGFPLGREGRTEPLLCVNGEREEFHTPARSGWEGGGGAAGA